MKAKSPAKIVPFGDDFRTSKRDKRLIKRNTLISRIAKNAQPQKRRGPKKNLAIESLASALEEALPEAESQDPASQVNIIKQKTLRHKPGAMKRRDKVEKIERQRFGKNMAEMAGLQPAPPASSNSEATSESNPANPTANRWSALRNFISQTMEQQPVFKNK